MMREPSPLNGSAEILYSLYKNCKLFFVLFDCNAAMQ